HTLTTSDISNGFAKVQLGTLSDGNYSITAVVTDTLGTESNPSAPFTVIEDTTPPTAPTISAVIDNVKAGTLTNGASTNDPSPTVTVSVNGTGAVTGDKIQLYDGNNPLGGPYVLTAAD